MSSESSQTDCMEVVRGTPNEGKSPIPVEGCYCKEGYVMDAGKCVLPEECGCLYEGSYYSVSYHGYCKPFLFTSIKFRISLTKAFYGKLRGT